MTNTDFELPYSGVFSGALGNSANPFLEPGHPKIGSNSARLKVPKGVSTVQVSSNLDERYTLVHQEIRGGNPVNTAYDFDGGGGLSSCRLWAILQAFSYRLILCFLRTCGGLWSSTSRTDSQGGGLDDRTIDAIFRHVLSCCRFHFHVPGFRAARHLAERLLPAPSHRRHVHDSSSVFSERQKPHAESIQSGKPTHHPIRKARLGALGSDTDRRTRGGRDLSRTYSRVDASNWIVRKRINHGVSDGHVRTLTAFSRAGGIAK